VSYFWIVLFPLWWLLGGTMTVHQVRKAVTGWKTVVFIMIIWPAFWAYVIVGANLDLYREWKRGRRP
jgi:hypothetical protein